ncbi:MAG TPA: discoidin domain-containing protein [Hyalangium sp.]|nr:discoidin domain-containing protein [Hyalangium sp.]
MTGSLPRMGTCPGCEQPATGERCTHCGVAVRVGPYRVRQVLGQRGAARTYLADDVDGLIVLKELSFSQAPSEATLRAFHQEAKQLQSLTHPRIPRYLDMLQLGLGADTRLYLVQEFIEGTPLETELAGRHSTELDARELARQVLDILRYLQNRSPQVFHGDLKPANLIRRPDGALFLVDFGAAWVRGGASAELSRYTPPEQTGGELDATTDLFALGVTLVDALSWDPQWKQRKGAAAEELATHLDVAPPFREFLERLTSVKPTFRFTSAGEALNELEVPQRLPRSLRRRVGPMALGAGAALLIFGAGFFAGRATSPTRLVDPPHKQLPQPERRTEQRPTPPPILPPQRASRPGVPNPPSLSDGSNSVGMVLNVVERWAPGHKPRPCELARNGFASASGHYESGLAGAAFDHDPATLWRSDMSTGAWLQVDLGSPRSLNALVVDWAWDTQFGTSAQSMVLTSLDGMQWTYLHKVINRSANNDIPRQLWFPQRVARYVRFTGMEWHGGLGHVRSLELYGPECPLEPVPSERTGGDQSNVDL